MNVLLSLVLISICIAQYQSQILNPNLDIFFRYLRPSFNMHRSSLLNSAKAYNRPGAVNFNRLLGTARVNGGKRALDANSQVDQLSCFFMNSTTLYCNNTVNSTEVQCDVSPNFDYDVLAQITNYVIGEKRFVAFNGTIVSKFYMYPKYDDSTTWGAALINQFGTDSQDVQRPVISLHTTDSMIDNGLMVTDSDCWNNLVDFLATSSLTDTISLLGSGETRRVAASLVVL